MSLDIGDMGIYGHEISFTYKKTFEADPEGFKKAQAEYDQAWQTYIIEKKKKKKKKKEI